MKLVIITGLSGAGKTQAVQTMEDMGFYCIDNMPPKLIPNFAEICAQSKLTQVAVVTDLRGGELFNDIYEALKYLKSSLYDFEILFLEADEKALIKRYKETRRRHPLVDSKTPVAEAIAKERKILSEIRKLSDNIIDTSNLSATEFKNQIKMIFSGKNGYEGIITHIVSFGFKHGIPLDADLVFDVRFLPNPFYYPELKEKTGNDKPVSEFVMKYEQSRQFLKMLCEMITYLIPHYVAEGKSQLVICIGCTGGQHRSVTIANKLYDYLKENNHNVFIRHRDCKK